VGEVLLVSGRGTSRCKVPEMKAESREENQCIHRIEKVESGRREQWLKWGNLGSLREAEVAVSSLSHVYSKTHSPYFHSKKGFFSMCRKALSSCFLLAKYSEAEKQK
jgi:hypothetical protein